MLKYISRENVENYKYRISALKSENLNVKDTEKVNKTDKIITYSKYVSRIYIFVDILFTFLNYTSKKKNFRTCKKVSDNKIKQPSLLMEVVYLILRVNACWLLLNMATNYYLINNSKLDLISKKRQDFEFSQYIKH